MPFISGPAGGGDIRTRKVCNAASGKPAIDEELYFDAIPRRAIVDRPTGNRIRSRFAKAMEVGRERGKEEADCERGHKKRFRDRLTNQNTKELQAGRVHWRSS